MGALRELPLDERVHIDGAFLVEVMVQMGPVAARELITDALGAIAVELKAVAEAMATLDSGLDRASALAHAVLACDRLSRTAWEMGLVTLSGVAVDAGLCAEHGDLVALRAVEARLQRVGRGSLCAAWEEAASG